MLAARCLVYSCVHSIADLADLDVANVTMLHHKKYLDVSNVTMLHHKKYSDTQWSAKESLPFAFYQCCWMQKIDLLVV